MSQEYNWKISVNTLGTKTRTCPVSVPRKRHIYVAITVLGDLLLDVGIKPMAHMDMSAVGIVAGCTSKGREGMIQGGQWNAWQKGCVRVRRHSHQIPSGSRIKVGIPGKSDPSGNEGRIMRIVPVMKATTYPAVIMPANIWTRAECRVRGNPESLSMI